MKILLVDNEKEIRLVLKELVITCGSGQHIIEEADGVVSGLEKINSFKPDIVLLDVEMNDGTGFDLLRQIPEVTFQLIFTTAHNEYAVQAFKFSAIDYLLKPIDPIELNNSLQRAKENINSQTMQKQLAVLMQQVAGKNESGRQIVIKDIDKTYFLKMNDILYCEAEGSYTKFYIVNSEPILVSRNLRYYEELLEPASFFRTHHSCLVNPNKIKVYDRKTDSGTLILEGGYTVPVSQRKKDFVLALLEGRGW
ncbi:MAG: response regulator transcription factor [Chitinophagaceae bacterium]|nr:response regulator transcription factor [Chitinophagaceae bacterium]MBK7309098.1 response regulator transcription factor [Chitinophagaceae bacterium]MBK8786634.1 response regulator transcription factor [Chitinophagaceae bacterium]MBK9483856.1 response regulator transcription factor [Chitinophagaceae bacterium]MBL0200583.1 response regulator transcription factor [Chitinophagaceae bacterium]